MRLSEFLADFDELDEQAGQALTTISEMVLGLGRKGRVDLQITVEKAGHQVETKIQLIEKPPAADAYGDIFFVEPEVGLSRSNPFQFTMNFDTGEIIDHPAGGGEPDGV